MCSSDLVSDQSESKLDPTCTHITFPNPVTHIWLSPDQSNLYVHAHALSFFFNLYACMVITWTPVPMRFCFRFFSPTCCKRQRRPPALRHPTPVADAATWSDPLFSNPFLWKNELAKYSDANCFSTSRQRSVVCPAARTISPTLRQQPPPRASSVHEPCCTLAFYVIDTTRPQCHAVAHVRHPSASFDALPLRSIRPSPRLVADLIASRSRRFLDAFSSHYAGPTATPGASLPAAAHRTAQASCPEFPTQPTAIRDRRHAPPCAYRTFPGARRA